MLPIKLIASVQFLILLTQTMAKVRPKVLVFDLDYTLWPFWVDTHVNPPFRKSSNGTVVDSSGTKIECYPEVPEVLKDLHEQGYVMAVASRTGEVEGANQLIDLLNWSNFFSHKEIYPGSKTKHLTNIKKAFDVKFSEMVFFDDEGRNIRDVADMGVYSVLVRKGVTKKVVDDALKEFSERRS